MMTTRFPNVNALKNLTRMIIRHQAKSNRDGNVVALLDYDLTDEEILILLRAVYAVPILKTCNRSVDFYGEHVRLCNNYRAILKEFTGAKRKLTFDEAKQQLLSYTDEVMQPLIRKYAQ